MAKTPRREIQNGDVIAARYEVRGSIGRGGMGRIYRVYDKVLGEEVALKTLLPEFVEDKVVLERFFNEARIARSLSHPNIVRVHDIGQAGDTVYISMELLKGKSLRRMLDQLQPGQRLPIAGILRMFDALCAALDYAHHFTVHRDIKPENVMILTDGSVKLMDFGISKLMSNPNLTSASVVMGTPHYMAPEQLRNTSAVDARADVYGVGVMLYEVLTGDRPAGMAKPASKLSGEVPAALDPIIESCCQPDPRKRCPSAGQLRADLRKVRIDIEQKSVSSDESAAGAGRPARSRLGRMVFASLALLALAAVALGGFNWAEARRNAILATSLPGPAAPLPPAAHEIDSSAAEFALLAGRLPDLRARAEAAGLEYPADQQAGVVKRVLDRGNELAAAAEQVGGTDPAQGLELGWDAVACYLVVAHWPESMLFVPPTPPAEPRQRGFLLDVEPVSIGGFARFCDEAKWPWPRGAYDSPEDAPMTGAAYFDAAACLASAQPPRRLPSRAELERALAHAAELGAVRPFGEAAARIGQTGDESETPLDEPAPIRVAYEAIAIPGSLHGVESWYEWTSSIGDRTESADPMFADRVLTVGGRWIAPNTFFGGAPQPWPYERSHDSLGFRGKIDLPRTLDELDRWN